MGIEIKLTGENAAKYLEANTPDTQTLATALTAAKQYIEVLEKQVKLYEPKTEEVTKQPSSRVIHDTDIAKDLMPDPNYSADPLKKFPPFGHGEIKPLHTGRWHQQEIDLISYAMSRPATEQNRRFETVVAKLYRSESSVRSKLSELGIIVKDGVLYIK